MNNPIMYADPSGYIPEWLSNVDRFMMASSWDPLIQSDMEAINWNPFNSNPDMSHVNKVSFYKGEAFILQDFAPSSFSYGIMFLHKKQYTDQNTVKYEWGHFAQMLILRPGVFTAFVAAPSLIYNSWGDYQNYNDYRYGKLYYSKVWERTADMLGGVNRNNYYDFWDIRNFNFW